MDDVTLARNVETEVFRGADSPEGTVDVNVVDGVVWLRDDRTSDLAPEAEPSPREVAEGGAGRPAAPLGARDGEERG